MLKNLGDVWGVGSMVGCWVENKELVYVVVRGFQEREWLSQSGRVQCLVDGNSGIMWSPKQPVVVSGAWNPVDVTVEPMTAEMAKGAVGWGLVYYGM